MEEALGIVAGTLTTGAFVPQVVRTWTTQSAKDISWGYLAIFTTGIALFLIYAVLIDSLALLLTEIATLLLLAALVIGKVRADRQESRV